MKKLGSCVLGMLLVYSACASKPPVTEDEKINPAYLLAHCENSKPVVDNTTKDNTPVTKDTPVTDGYWLIYLRADYKLQVIRGTVGSCSKIVPPGSGPGTVTPMPEASDFI